MKGPFLTVQSFVRSQPDPKDPTGTIVFVSSSLAGRIFPGFSSYSIGKLAEQRFGEYVDAGVFGDFLLTSWLTATRIPKPSSVYCSSRSGNDRHDPGIRKTVGYRSRRNGGLTGSVSLAGEGRLPPGLSSECELGCGRDGSRPEAAALR